jgi:hypothetical protein
MAIYIFRRLLVMIPTFFAISFVIFILINLVPGTPGQLADSQGRESADESESKREAYRIFKEQFHLDKPVLFNFRYALEEEEILTYLSHIARQSEDPSLKNIIHAEETLESYGQYAVPHIVKIILATKNEEIRRAAVKKFSENARGRFFREYSQIEGTQAEELMARFKKEFPDFKQKDKKLYRAELLNFVNRNINERNAYIRGLWYRKQDPEPKKKKVIEEINTWYKSHLRWYQYSGWEKAKITFWDTRFAHYWWNLLHLDFGISHRDKKPVLPEVLSRAQYSISPFGYLFRRKTKLYVRPRLDCHTLYALFSPLFLCSNFAFMDFLDRGRLLAYFPHRRIQGHQLYAVYQLDANEGYSLAYCPTHYLPYVWRTRLPVSICAHRAFGCNSIRLY